MELEFSQTLTLRIKVDLVEIFLAVDSVLSLWISSTICFLDILYNWLRYQILDEPSGPEKIYHAWVEVYLRCWMVRRSNWPLQAKDISIVLHLLWCSQLARQKKCEVGFDLKTKSNRIHETTRNKTLSDKQWEDIMQSSVMLKGFGEGDTLDHGWRTHFCS
jgi:hypothetical protein